MTTEDFVKVRCGCVSYRQATHGCPLCKGTGWRWVHKSEVKITDVKFHVDE